MGLCARDLPIDWDWLTPSIIESLPLLDFFCRIISTLCFLLVLFKFYGSERPWGESYQIHNLCLNHEFISKFA